jgi:hypothetical protein
MQKTKIDWLSHVGAIKAQAGSTAAYARQHKRCQYNALMTLRPLRIPVNVTADSGNVTGIPVNVTDGRCCAF